MKVASIIAVLFGVFTYGCKNQNESAVKNVTTPAATNSPQYCLAIRGNGERMPAHWGAISRLVEDFGLPQKMAGGSSASITMFLLESIANSPLAQTNEQKAFLIKSIEGYVEALSQTEEGKEILGVLQSRNVFTELFMLVSQGASLTPMQAAELQIHLAKVLGLMEKPYIKQLINPEFIYYVAKTYEMSKNSAADKAVLQYRLNEIQFAVNNFGKFDAVTDKTLFFRPGIINFDHIANIVGTMGDFYAQSEFGQSQQFKDKFQAVVNKCTIELKDKTWSQLANLGECRKPFTELVVEYHQLSKANLPMEKRRINQPIGRTINAFPTTSLLTNDAMKQYMNQKEAYETNKNPSFGMDFKLDKVEDLRYGYWGTPQNLNFPFADDRKSKRFLALGQASWRSAIATSPAEPGLANFQMVPHGPSDMISAGGWNDLHPTIVLKAAGCENNIVYLTRRGGDSWFGQNVYYRLTGMNGFDQQAAIQDRNVLLNKPDEIDSEWGQIYNLQNPNSSYARSLQLADAVICTNWDADFPDKMASLVKDGFAASVYLKENSKFSSSTFKRKDQWQYPNDAGCFPKP